MEEVPVDEHAHHHQPVRFGLTFRYQLNDRWSLESGLTYTRLTADISTVAQGVVADCSQSLTYIGIPLAVSYQLWAGSRFGVYASAGCMVEKMVKGQRTWQDHSASVSIRQLQFSLNVGVGAELKLTDWLSLFAEPGLGCYFDNGSSVPTYYQEHPLGVNLNVGLRLDVK